LEQVGKSPSRGGVAAPPRQLAERNHAKSPNGIASNRRMKMRQLAERNRAKSPNGIASNRRMKMRQITEFS
jgi:hypothetical protein